MNPLIVALDVPSVDEATELSTRIGDAAGLFKIGLELWGSAGPEAARAIHAPVFLDLKLHDIPTTVERAVQTLKPVRPAMLTVHALGGRAMIEAAAGAKPEGCTLLAVTALTSMSDDDLADVGLPKASEIIPMLASLAREAGADGIVCSPHDVRAARAVCPKPFVIVTPGVRPAGATSNDQARVGTPREAIEAGADYIVVGRPVTRAENPRAAAEAIRKECE